MFYKPPMGHRFIAGLVVGFAASAGSTAAWAQQASPPAQSPTPSPAASAPAPPPAPPVHITAAQLTAAKKHYAEGEKKMHAEKYDEALVEFKAADDIKSTPQAERNIGFCEDKLGHYPEAVDWYQKFLAHVPEKLASTGDEVKKRTAEIQAMTGKVHFESDPAGATVTVDDKPQASVTPIDVDLAPGQHEVKFTEAGRLPATKTIDVTFASTQNVSQELAPEPPPPPPPPPPVAVAPLPPPPAPVAPPPEPRSLVPAYITGGLAIAAAGVGTVFGVMALNDKSDFDKNPTTSTADNGDTHSLICDMAFGIAITFGVTSAVLYFTKDEPAAGTAQRSHPTTRVARRSSVTLTPVPIVGAHLGGAGFALRF